MEGDRKACIILKRRVTTPVIKFASIWIETDAREAKSGSRSMLSPLELLNPSIQICYWGEIYDYKRHFWEKTDMIQSQQGQ